ncbi:hypothetical protein IFR05_002983 [Cadophora sp. M221]|nr:hypothetical protein IFR05_002983 [Cadophora sp. M221]
MQWELYKTPLFAVLSTVIFLQGAVHYVPPCYLSTFAADVGLESWKQALLLAALNVASIPGQMTFGWLGDIYGSYHILTLGGLTSGLTVMLIWGVARDLTSLLVFALACGIVTGGVSTSRSTLATTLTKGCSNPSQEIILLTSWDS